MTITMDQSGRLVIPREIRREAALEAGTPLDIRVHDGKIEIEPMPLEPKLVRRGKLTVAVAVGEVPPLTHDLVEKTRKALRHRTEPKRK